MFVQNTGADAGGSSVVAAIRSAAQATGTNFGYLLATARVESSLNPNASASSSSAKGLYQFIEQTWLTTVKQSGANLGFGREADAISRGADGRYQVSDPAMKRSIMAMRNDPRVNAVMAGAFTQRNAAMLTEKIGRKPSEGELYAAHFLGASGAARLINNAARSPQSSAADLFPRAAAANRSIFYNNQGQARSVSEVYGVLVGRYNVARASPAVQTASAADPAAVSRAVAAADRVTAVRSAAPPSAMGAAAPADRLASAEHRGPAFQSLFRSDPDRAPVSQTIQTLWSTRPQVAAALTGQQTPPTGSAAIVGEPLDLFPNQGTDAKSLFGVGS